MSVGNVNNGDHATGLRFLAVVTDPKTPLAFSYSIYNGNASQLSKSLEDLTQSAAENALDDILNPSPPESGPADYGADQDGDPWNEPGSANVGWLTLLSYLGISDFVFPDCDGFVAMDSVGRTLENWDAAITASPNSILRTTTRYPGSNSAAGCGSNSDYAVTWSLARERIVGSVRQFLKNHALTLDPGMRSLS
jgi:hypothetical protein